MDGDQTMKLTKEKLKEMVQEIVANMQERKLVRSRGTNVAGVGRVGDDEVDWYETGKLQRAQAQRAAADAKEFQRQSYIDKEKRRKEDETRRSKAARQEQKKIYGRIAPDVEKAIANIANLLVQTTGRKVDGFFGPEPMRFYGAGIAQTYIDAVLNRNRKKNEIRNAIDRLGSAESLDEIVDQLAVLRENPPKNTRINDYADWFKSFDEVVSKRIEKATGSKTGEKRSFMQKAGSFLTGKGFKESKLRVSQDDLSQIIKEELQAVKKGK